MKIILLATVIFLTACTTSSAYLDIAGAAWRKPEAFSAHLFSVGNIETAGRNRFDPKGSVTLENFPIQALTIMHSKKTVIASLEAEGKLPPNVSDFSGDLKSKMEERLNGKYVVFRNLETYTLVDKLNEPANEKVLARLKLESEPVIVTGVAIVSDNEVYKKTDSGGGVQASIPIVTASVSPGSNAVVKVNGTKSLVTEASFSDGTIFAYEYSQIVWDSSSDKPKVKELKVLRPMNPWF